MVRIVYGIAYDSDGSGNIMEDDEPLGSGSKATHYITLAPSNVKRFILKEVSFYMNPTNAVTYQLHLIEKSVDLAIEEYSRTIYSSDSGRAKDTIYHEAESSLKMKRTIMLETVAKLYYKIDWSGAPGNTPGWIRVRGEVI